MVALPRTLPHRHPLAPLADALWYVCQAIERPKTRADCIDGPRPCPWASCPHHLLGDVTALGTYRVRAQTQRVRWSSKSLHPGNPVSADTVDEIATVLTTLPETCALDIADQTDTTNEERPTAEIASLLRLSAWRTRQAERSARAKMADMNTPGKPERRAIRSRTKGGDFTNALDEAIAEKRLAKLKKAAAKRAAKKENKK